jgi:hypothetical protein
MVLHLKPISHTLNFIVYCYIFRSSWNHHHEGVWGSGCIDPYFLDLGISWRVVSFMPRPLYPRGKSPRYPLDRRLAEPQSRSGRRGEEKILDPTPDSNSDPLVVQPVTSRYTDCAILAHENILSFIITYIVVIVAVDHFQHSLKAPHSAGCMISQHSPTNHSQEMNLGRVPSQNESSIAVGLYV